jgi:predicted RNase H-like nuclease (RuvC/YqgF family)
MVKKGGDSDSLIDESLFTKPKQEEFPPRNVTVDLFQKENAQLRSQINQYQANNNDWQRQLDNCSMKITKLEQLLSYEKHENLTLNETLK